MSLSLYCFAVTSSTPDESLLRNCRNDCLNKKTSIRWATLLNTNSGSASAITRSCNSDDSRTNSGLVPAFPAVGRATCCAISWLCVDMVCDLGVSSIVPARKTLCPASPSLQWVPWANSSPPSRFRCCWNRRYYDPLRLPNVYLRIVRSSLSDPDTLRCSSHSYLIAGHESFSAMPGFYRFFAGRTHHTDICARRSFGSPQFPSYPFEHMPWSKTPVVTRMLAKSPTGFLPSAKSSASAFLTLIARVILADHNYTFFGAQYRACTLDSSGSRLPLPGLPAEFTTELPAKLYSGRTSTCWVTISNFIYLSIDSQRFGLHWARG